MKASFRDLPRLSPAELEVMKVLWQADGLSAREVHARVARDRDRSYSTTRTLIDRLVGKHLVAKESFHGLHVYRPSISRAAGLARMVRDFAQQVLGDSHGPLVSLVAGSRHLDPDEVEELERLLDDTLGQDR